MWNWIKSLFTVKEYPRVPEQPTWQTTTTTIVKTLEPEFKKKVEEIVELGEKIEAKVEAAAKEVPVVVEKYKKEVEEFIAAEAAMAKAELNKVEKVVETEVEAVKEAVKKVTRRKK